MATRPRGATFKANVSPAMPLPNIRKSNCLVATLLLLAQLKTHGKAGAWSGALCLQRRVVDQLRRAYKDGEGHLRSLSGPGGGFECFRIEAFDVIQPRLRLAGNQFGQLPLEPAGGHRRVLHRAFGSLQGQPEDGRLLAL